MNIVLMNKETVKIIDSLKKVIAELEEETKEGELQEFNGLMWSNSIGKDLTFDQAKEFARDCRDGGFSDWRVPTARELADTIDYEKGANEVTRGAHGNYWSSTQDSATDGWYLNFYSGYSSVNSSSKACGFSVRCVRELKDKV